MIDQITIRYKQCTQTYFYPQCNSAVTHTARHSLAMQSGQTRDGNYIEKQGVQVPNIYVIKKFKENKGAGAWKEKINISK